MAVHDQNMVDIDLSTGSVMRTFMNRTLGEGDKNYTRYGVRCFRNKQKVNLAGCTVMGYFVKANGQTVIIEGATANTNEAYVTLPQACYSVEGQFTLAIKISSTDFAGTVRIIDGTVVNTTTETLIDPGTVISSLTNFDSAVAAASSAAALIGQYTVQAVLVSGDNYDIQVATE